MYRISILDYTYIGSTRDFNQRKKKHKNACNNPNNSSYNYKVYQMIREAGGWDKCEMVPVEEYECENGIQARMREEVLRKEYNALMNTNKASHNKQEYNAEYWVLNKEKLEIQKKEWYNANKERVSQKGKEWYEANKVEVLEKLNKKYSCECGGCYTHCNKKTHDRTQKHLKYINSLI